MRKGDRFRPYIRRGNRRERAPTFRSALRLAFHREWSRDCGKPYYVLVQRGWPNLVIESGFNREMIVESLIGPRRVGGFPTWASRIKRFGRLVL